MPTQAIKDVANLKRPTEDVFSSYSLHEDKENKQKGLEKLTRQTDLVNSLFSKADDKQRQQLIMKKKRYAEERVEVEKAIHEINYIQTLAREYIAFFDFFWSAYTFSLDVLYAGEKRSHVRKVLEYFKNLEAKLLNLENVKKNMNFCLIDLNYDEYQRDMAHCCLNFFADSSFKLNFYSDYAILSRKIYDRFVNSYHAIKQDKLELEQVIVFFTQEKVDKLPVSEHRLIGLWIFFLYNLLFFFVNLRPVGTHLNALEASIQFCSMTLYFPSEENYFYKLLELKKTLTKLKIKGNENFPKNKEYKSTKQATDSELHLLEKMLTEVMVLKKSLADLFRSERSLNMYALLSGVVFSGKTLDLLTIFRNKTGLDFSVIRVDEVDHCASIGPKDVLKNFFYILYTTETYTRLASNLSILNETLNIYDIHERSLESFINVWEVWGDFTLKDFVAVSYFSLCVLAYPLFYSNLIAFEETISRLYLYAMYRSLTMTWKVICDLQDVIDPKLDSFFNNTYLVESVFLQDKKKLIDEVDLNLNTIQNAILFFKKIENFSLNKFSNSKFCDLVNKFPSDIPSSVKDSHKLLGSLKNKQEEFLVHKSRLLSYQFFVLTNANFKRGVNISSVATIAEKEKSLNKDIIDFDLLLKTICKNSRECLSYIKKYKSDSFKKSKTLNLNQRFSSALGQIRATINKISIFFAIKTPVSFITLLNKIKEVVEQHQKEIKIPDFGKNIADCRLVLVAINEEITDLSKAYRQCNTKLKVPLAEINSLLDKKSSSFFYPDLQIKQFDQIISQYADGLARQFSWLQSLIKVICYEPNEVLLELYEVMVQYDQYQSLLDCLKQQLENVKIISTQVKSNEGEGKESVPDFSKQKRKKGTQEKKSQRR